MDREFFILAILSTADKQSFTPVQIQKLFFLMQKKFPEIIHNEFNFIPYAYGPFDKAIYEEMDKLKNNGYVEIQNPSNVTWSLYCLTEKGLEQGKMYFYTLSESVQEYALKYSNFVRSLSFSELVSAVYKEYPDMKVNSVFKELK